jgi:hypothetical protein
MLCFSLSVENLPAEQNNITSPPLEIEPQILDFGRVHESKDFLELTFTIKNISNIPIEIANVNSSCGCTTANLPQMTLTVGDSVSVPVKVNILGRRGYFEKSVQLDVVGYDESIVVPIKGKIIQDIWFDGPFIQCFAKESESMVEKTFEIHTVDWPLVQFDLKLIDKAIHIEEISRVKENDETIIKLHLQMEVPLDQVTTSYHLVLAPLDKKIKQIILPIVCYRSLLQKSKQSVVLKDGKSKNEGIIKNVSGLHPNHINLGLISGSENRRFDVTGPPELLCLLKVVDLEQLPQGTNVTLYYSADLNKEVLGITIRIGESLKSGLVKGIIHLQSPQGDKFPISVIGLMGPQN